MSFYMRVSNFSLVGGGVGKNKIIIIILNIVINIILKCNFVNPK